MGKEQHHLVLNCIMGNLQAMFPQCVMLLQEVCNDVVLSETRLSQLSAEVKRLRDQVNSGRPYHVQQLRTVQGKTAHFKHHMW